MHQETKQELAAKALLSLTSHQVQLLQHFINNPHEEMFLSQGTMAKHTKVWIVSTGKKKRSISERTVIRALIRYKDLKLIATYKKHRPGSKWKSNHYFFNVDIKQGIKELIAKGFLSEKGLKKDKLKKFLENFGRKNKDKLAGSHRGKSENCQNKGEELNSCTNSKILLQEGIAFAPQIPKEKQKWIGILITLGVAKDKILHLLAQHSLETIQDSFKSTNDYCLVNKVKNKAGLFIRNLEYHSKKIIDSCFVSDIKKFYSEKQIQKAVKSCRFMAQKKQISNPRSYFLATLANPCKFRTIKNIFQRPAKTAKAKPEYQKIGNDHIVYIFAIEEKQKLGFSLLNEIKGISRFFAAKMSKHFSALQIKEAILNMHWYQKNNTIRNIQAYLTWQLENSLPKTV